MPSSKVTFVTMNLQSATNHLNQTFANGHEDWISRFAAIPEGDTLKDNDQMKEIFELLPTKDPISEEQMAACVNNEETTTFLGINASEQRKLCSLPER